MTVATARVRIRLDGSSNGMILTPEEFDAITEYDDTYSYELIHGVVVVSPIASEGERDPNEELGHLLRLYGEQHARGESLDATLSEQYVRTADSRRRADRVIWAGLGRCPDPKTDTPMIVVEFVSRRKRDRRRDYEEKREEYLAVGVVEYWVIDRFRRRMVVYRSDGSERIVGPDESYETVLLPGFEVPLGRLLRLADRWTRSKRG
jgi:Uma2 family endonuclease